MIICLYLISLLFLSQLSATSQILSSHAVSPSKVRFGAGLSSTTGQSPSGQIDGSAAGPVSIVGGGVLTAGSGTNSMPLSKLNAAFKAQVGVCKVTCVVKSFLVV